MIRNLVRLIACVICTTGTWARADIAAIHEKELPQESPVLSALEDAQALEPYSSSFVDRWNYPIEKKDVAKRVERDLNSLHDALKRSPENSELQLLTGLVAHYAYNLDVNGSHETAVDSLDAARRLLPEDIRPQWFLAALQCQTIESKAGADKFLAIEATHSANELPAAFWNDYIECAGVTNMPAHLLHAAFYLEKSSAPESRITKVLVESSRKRFEPFDPGKKYDPKDVWQGARAVTDVVFTSTMCGIRIHARQDWAVNMMELNNGSCVASFNTGPYKAVVDSLRPGVLVLIQMPKGNETLQEFSKRFLTNGTFEPDQTLHCPTDHCIALKALQPGMYKADGDGHGRVVFFERAQPEFPGLALESPIGLPSTENKEGPSYYRPNQIQQRIPGKLYYLVLLDTASSIETPALRDFDYFLRNLSVE
jgi:hypothetical protein